MPRNLGTVIGNNLSKGLITEATGMNFPENAATDALNVVFDPIGSVRRRKGIDVEGGADTLAYTDDVGVIKEYVWQAVALTGGFTFLVLQTGSVVHFYELTTSAALSQGIAPVSVDLTEFKAPEAGGGISSIPCSFTSGNGWLFIAHPNCDPVLVRWDDQTNEFETARISIRIRDFEGVEDDVLLTVNPPTLSDQHHYNLQNQGWSQEVRVGTVDNEIGEGGQYGSVPNGKLKWSLVGRQGV